MLRYGTWLAAGVTAMGLALALLEGHTGPLPIMRMVTAGIALFILLPVLRVFLMLGHFSGKMILI